MDEQTQPIEVRAVRRKPAARRKPFGRARMSESEMALARAQHPLMEITANGVKPVGLSLADFLALRPPEIKLRYSVELDKAHALQELSDLRRIAEQAAQEINNRLKPEEDKCVVCGKEIPPGTKFVGFVLIRDHATGTAEQKVVCSIPCQIEYNRQNRGRAALVDSGEVAVQA
jgi:predicted nucleic acid-binding Zn ribbon protein